MNIILTRPLNDTENLMQELFSLGHKIMHIPTLKIRSANLEKFNLKDYNALVFTSSNAVRNLNVNGEKKNVKCFCVGSVTEKIARLGGFTNTISASGNVNALKNLIINSKELKKSDNLAYISGDQITVELDKELKREGFKVKKFINYFSEKITSINEVNIELIKKYPPDVIFVYSLRSAESFNSIVANYSLAPMMTQSTVMCISKKIKDYFTKSGWKKTQIFNPGEEIIKLELEAYVSKSTNKFDNSLVSAMESPAKFFPIVIGFFIATNYITVEGKGLIFLDQLNRSLITILIFLTFHQAIGPLSVLIKSVSDLLSKDLIDWIIKIL